MSTIWLVRHGQTVYNVAKKIQGVADSPLTERGRSEAAAFGRGVTQAGVRFAAAYSSDLVRATETAQLALQAAGQPLSLQVQAGLREQDYGEFEGWPVNRFARQVLGTSDFAAALANGAETLESIAAKTHAASRAVPPAESAAQAVARFDHALRQIAAATAGPALVVTHGTVLVLWLHALGFATPGRTGVGNATATQVRWQAGRFEVLSFDETTFRDAGGKTHD